MAALDFPSSPTTGQVYTANSRSWKWDGSTWLSVATGGPTGLNVFYESNITVASNYTITSSRNAMCTGPITINSGVSVTIPSGSRLVVL